MGQRLHGDQKSSLRIIWMISLSIISPQNILGIPNPNEIWFFKGKQTAMILSSGNIMGKVFGIYHWEELGSSVFICQQHDREFESQRIGRSSLKMPGDATNIHKSWETQVPFIPVLKWRFGCQKERNIGWSIIFISHVQSTLEPKGNGVCMPYIWEDTVLITHLLQKLQTDSEAIPLGTVQIYGTRYPLLESD